MDGDIESVGTLATAGLAAHALDSRGGKAGDVASACQNCETPVSGRFCPNCGQSTHIHRTMGHVLEEFAHGIWHFDTKAWRTIPLLIFRPGRLTRDYIDGRRARYIAPLALFLFTIFLMFFVFGLTTSADYGNAIILDDSPAASADRIKDARDAVAEAQREVKQAETELAAARKDPEPGYGEIGQLEGNLVAQRAGLDVAKAALKRAEASAAPPAAKPGVPAAKRETWMDKVKTATQSDDFNFSTGNKLIDVKLRQSLQNPELALYKVQQKAYKLSFLLVPMSLPLLWLMFVFRRGITMYDHTVFALYSLSFISLLVVFLALAARAGAGEPFIPLLAVFAPPVHMFAQLKGTYRLGRFGALWRTFTLVIGAIAVLAVYFIFIVLIGLLD